MLDFVSKWWCRIAHQKVYRPVRGYYRCTTCLRAWPVPWETVQRNPLPESREAWRASEAQAEDQYATAGT